MIHLRRIDSYCLNFCSFFVKLFSISRILYRLEEMTVIEQEKKSK